MSSMMNMMVVSIRLTWCCFGTRVIR